MEETNVPQMRKLIAQAEQVAFETRRRARDLAMIKNPDTWPRWPHLPLKLRNGDSSSPHFCGVMLDNREHRLTVFISNIFGGKLSEAEKRQFPSLDALIDEYTVD